MTRLVQCLLLVTVVAAARAVVSSIEIYDGSYYGLDDPHNAVIVSPASGPGQPAYYDQEQPSSGHGGSNRRGGHHRGRHGHGHGHHHHHRHHHGGNMTNSYQWSDEQKLAHVCAMITPNNSETSRRSGRHQSYHGEKMARKLQMLSVENRQTVIDMWNRRKQDMLRCCNEDSTNQKLQCVNQTRLARYDRVCRQEEPLCAWAQFIPYNRQSRSGQSPEASTQSTTNTTTICCQRQGSARLECFSAARAEYRQQYEQMKKRTHHGRGSHDERRRADSDSAHGEERTAPRRGGGGNRRPRPDVSRD